MSKSKLFVDLRNSGKTTALKKLADGKSYLHLKLDNANWSYAANICSCTNIEFDYLLFDDISLDNLSRFHFNAFTKNEEICFSMTMDANDVPLWVLDKFDVIECNQDVIFSTNKINK